VDGFASARLIRENEKDKATNLSFVAKELGRTPIFAVSASLKADDVDKFVDVGFDGWLLKPIDFRRLNLILTGAFSTDIRTEGLYDRSRFKLGGWFTASLVSK
jgi:CheY-like chemotaxis protein